MTDDLDEVRDYYAQFHEREWLRLSRGEGLIEFEVTTHALSAYLPKTGRILDIGGGPGRYAIWLAERGYQVVLADLSPNLLELARLEIAKAGVESNVETIAEADARDLSRWAGESFDAVLSLGPFYHLPALRDRKAAAEEMARVLRPGGIAFAAFMPRYTFVRRTLAIADERKHLSDPKWVEQLVAEGRFVNDNPGRFNAAYAALPNEIEPFFAGFNFQHLALLALESLAPGLDEVISDLAQDDPPTYEAALALIIDAAADPSIHGMSNHLLYVGRKT